MKVMYVEARNKKLKDEDYFIDPNFISHLPKEIFLAYTIQNIGQAEAMKRALEANNISVKGFQQVLGCTKLKTPYNIVLIGQGRFHALNLALQNPEHPILLYSNGSSIAVGEREIKEIEQKKNASISKFLYSENIGIIVSTKPGQENLDAALKIKEKIGQKYPDKKIYLFISNNINARELENFGIDSWINTACPGLAFDSPKIVNIDDIFPFL